MTSESEFTEFKKIAGDENKSTFTYVSKDELEDEILDAVEEAKSPYSAKPDGPNKPVETQTKTETKVEVKIDRPMANALRRMDHVTKNRTCASCLERKLIDQFALGKKSDFCIECEGK